MKRCALLILSLCLSFPSLAADTVQIDDAWSRATAPGARTGAAYMTLNSKQGDRLLAAEVDVAGRTELHEHRVENAVAQMRQVPAIEVPAGQTVTLQPGGLHLMLMGLKAPLAAGSQFSLRLKFEKAGEQVVGVTVRGAGGSQDANAGAMDHSGQTATHKPAAHDMGKAGAHKH